jgi:hypothetical protein
MSEIVESILKSCGRELDADAVAKITGYLQILSSAGTRDSQRLVAYGLAYIEHLNNPDPRYTGC